MTMTVEDLRSCIGREVVDREGEKSGKVQSVFYDTVTNEPAWLAVRTGMFGRHSTLVPLAGARPEGDTIQVPYEKETIKNAPEVEDDQPIDSRQASELMDHYGLREQAGPTERKEAADRQPEGPQGDRWIEPRAPTASTIGTDASAELLGIDQNTPVAGAGSTERAASTDTGPGSGPARRHTDTPSPAPRKSSTSG